MIYLSICNGVNESCLATGGFVGRFMGFDRVVRLKQFGLLAVL